MELITWGLTVWGLAAILALSGLFEKPRLFIARVPLIGRFLGELARCPMCQGFWIGLAGSWWYSPTAAWSKLPCMTDGFLAAGACLVLHSLTVGLVALASIAEIYSRRLP